MTKLLGMGAGVRSLNGVFSNDVLYRGHGTPYRARFAPDIPFQRLPSETLPDRLDDDEKNLFGDILDVSLTDPNHLQGLEARYWDLLDDDVRQAGEAVRHLSWVWYRLADTQMWRAQGNAAILCLKNARMALSHWAEHVSPAYTRDVEGLLDLWHSRESLWTLLIGQLNLASQNLRNMPQIDGAAPADRLCWAGLELLSVADRLAGLGYPAYAHNVLHYGGEATFLIAEEIFRTAQLPSKAHEARSHYERARRLNKDLHAQMFVTTERLPAASKEGLTVYRPADMMVWEILDDLCLAFLLDRLPVEATRPALDLGEKDSDALKQALQTLRQNFSLSVPPDPDAVTAAALWLKWAFQTLERDLGHVPGYVRPVLQGLCERVGEVLADLGSEHAQALRAFEETSRCLARKEERNPIWSKTRIASEIRWIRRLSDRGQDRLARSMAELLGRIKGVNKDQRRMLSGIIAVIDTRMANHVDRELVEIISIQLRKT